MSDVTSSNNQNEQNNRGSQLEITESIREERYHHLWTQVIKLLEILAIAIFALIALKLGFDYLIQKQRIELERQAQAATPPPPAEAPNSTLILLQKLLESSPPGTSEGTGRQPGKTVSLSAVFGLIDKFVAAGAVPVKEAMKLKDELTKNAIEGGKEILVDTAKKLIDKLLSSSKEGSLPNAGDAQGERGIHITQYCGATSTYQAPRQHKKSPCPKEKPTEKPAGECKAP